MKSHKTVKVFKIALFVILTVGIVSGAVLFADSCKLENVYVYGSEKYSEEKIESLLLDGKSDSFAPLVYLKYRLLKQKSIPFVEYVDVVLENEKTISLYVYEKTIAGCIEVMGDYMYFDKDGIIVESSEERLPDVALVKGLNYDRIVMNESLIIQDSQLFEIINDIRLLAVKNSLKIEAIEFDSSEAATIYIDGVIVKLGKRLKYDEALGALPGILDALNVKNVLLDMSEYTKTCNYVIAKAQK